MGGPTHTGLSYHAPGPDGQPWLHLRGPGGDPAPNWHLSQDGPHASVLPSGMNPQMTGTSAQTGGAVGAGEEEGLQVGGGAGAWQDPQSGGGFYNGSSHVPMM